MSKAGNITTVLCGLSRNSGSLKLPETSGPVQACIGIAIIFTVAVTTHTHTHIHTHTHTHRTHTHTKHTHMTEIQSKPNYQLYPMSQLCVTKGNRNIRIGMLGTVILVCTSGQGIRADVVRFPLLAAYILFLCTKHNSK